MVQALKNPSIKIFLSWSKFLPQTTKCSFNWSINWKVVWFTKRRPSAVPRAHVDTSTCLVLSVPTEQNLNKSSLLWYKWYEWYFFFAQSYKNFSVICAARSHISGSMFSLFLATYELCVSCRGSRGPAGFTGTWRHPRACRTTCTAWPWCPWPSLTPQWTRTGTSLTQTATFQHLKRKYSSKFSPSIGLQKWLQHIKNQLYRAHMLCLPSLSLDV